MPATLELDRSSVEAPRSGASATQHRESRPSVADATTRSEADERAHRARILAALAGGRRRLLQQMRADYLKRLHRRSDDLGATEGLRVVEDALRLLPRVEGPEAAQGRIPRRRRRWWRRGRDAS
jgi:hypothetical protein